MSTTIDDTVSQKGTPMLSSTKCCRMKHTTKKRTAAPVIFDNRKKEAPVL